MEAFLKTSILKNNAVIYFKSKRSRFITLFHAATKSTTNFSLASLHAYTSAIARNSELEPKIKSALVAVHFTAPVLRSCPSKTPFASDAAFQVVSKLIRFVQKPFETVPFFYLLLLKDLFTTRSRTEKVLVMVRDKVLQFFHA